ncbi:hypothetical protein GF386_00370 [Candidatus Pacearchaeota archaeon]|nr:hypothetical protein [Candidatus Pacearchaeota archaeon]MBD3282737.1 hypothetical protein [Candidatus Pacearchaeota archaeon]
MKEDLIKDILYSFLIIIGIVLLVIFIFLFLYSGDSSFEETLSKNGSSEIPEETEEISNESSPKQEFIGGAAGGGSGGGSGDDEDEEEIDYSEKPCGFYFRKEGICNGTCPAGECVLEDNSCYCKL